MESYFVLVMNVRDPVTYDVVFVRDEPDLTGVTTVSGSVSFYELDSDTFKKGKVVTKIPYTVRLSRVDVKSQTGVHIIKYETIRHLLTNDNVLSCVVDRVDEFGRLVVELIDDDGMSISDWLTSHYEANYVMRSK